MRTLQVLFVCMAGLVATACTGEHRPIALEQLPAAAQQFISVHFEGVQVAYVIEDKDFMSKSYDLGFVSGDKIEFAKDGEWTDVDCKYSAVPASMLPTQLANYLGKTYPAIPVKQIERDKRGYEVKLDNGFELKFDSQFRMMRMDD